MSENMKHHCPKCKLILRCGCKSCVKRHGKHDNMMGYNDDGYSRSCPKCGFTLGADEWLDIEYEQVVKPNSNQDTTLLDSLK